MSANNAITNSNATESDNKKDIVADIIAAANVAKKATKSKKAKETVEKQEVDVKEKSTTKGKKIVKKNDDNVVTQEKPVAEDKPAAEEKPKKPRASKKTAVAEEKTAVAEEKTAVAEEKTAVAEEKKTQKKRTTKKTAEQDKPLDEKPSEEKTTEEVANEEEHLKKMKVGELKDLCKSRNISVSSKAKKEEMIQLLIGNNTVAKEVTVATEVTTKEVPVVEEDYKKMTVTQLKTLCKERSIEVSSKMKKEELVALLEKPFQKRRETPILQDDSDDESEVPAQSEPHHVVQQVVVSDAPDYSKMTVAELKNQCKSRGIEFSSKSKKDDLIGLLVIADNQTNVPEDIPEKIEEEEKSVEKKSRKSKKTQEKETAVVNVPVVEVNVPVVEVNVPVVEVNVPTVELQPEPVEDTSSISSASQDNTEYAVANEEDDEFVEKQTVLLEHNGVKYWMDTEDNASGLHDIYEHTTLDHIGFFNKHTNEITRIDA